MPGTPAGSSCATAKSSKFRDTAYRLGLHTSLSIPMFAGRGEPIAAVNLYGHDPDTMTALTAAVWATYDEAVPNGLNLPDLDPGGAELVNGLCNAFAVRAIIQQAIGIIIATQRSTPDEAYVDIRLRGAARDRSLLNTAEGSIAERR